MRKIIDFLIGLFTVPALVALFFGYIKLIERAITRDPSLAWLMVLGNFIFAGIMFIPPIIVIRKWNQNKIYSMGLLCSSFILFVMISIPSCTIQKQKVIRIRH